MAYSLFDLLLRLFLYSLNSLFLLTSLSLIFMIIKSHHYSSQKPPIYNPNLGYSQIPILPLIPLLIPLIIPTLLLPQILVLFTPLPLLSLQDTLSLLT